MVNVREMRTLERASQAVELLKKQTSKNWLAVQYRRFLYGGWTREDGSTAPAHSKAIKFHEAAKALFCAWCEHYLGQIGSDPDETWVCEGCGETNRLPPVDSEPGDILMSGPTFSKHFPLTLNPYFEQRMGDQIVWENVVKNQQKCTVLYPLKNGDRVHCLSYEQALKIGHGQTSAFEGPRWKLALFDEPPPRSVWVATKRGLLRWMSKYTKPPFAQCYQTIFIGGGNQSSKSFTTNSEFAAEIRGERPWDGSLCLHKGRAFFAATPLEAPWMFHEIYQMAWNKGGPNRSIFCIEFDITDNPSLTPKAIKAFEEGLSPEEREARLHGRFKHLSGRIFNEFDPEVHVYDPATFDPLREKYKPGVEEPSSLPLVMAVDPHPRKPWFMLWVALGTDGRKYVVDEWPNEDYFRMKYSHLGLDDYAAIIRDKEACMPGGENRVLWREFDPNMSRTPKTVAEGSTTLVDEMQDRGLYFESDVNDKIDFGHSLIHTLLGWDTDHPISQTNRPMLYISSKCQNLLFAFENYIWDDKNASDPERQGPVKPKDIGKDPIDALRYCLAREQDYIDWRNVMGGFEGHYDQALSDLENW